ncbi:MAG: Ig-like domain-containing protein, partial [Oscillospiraceae bacterium]|nr:Ig-like domain-containing protein [Oscillospiraceae bacterium]
MKHSMEKHATEKINSRQGILPLVLTILLLITAVLSIVKIAQSESESESETIASFAVPVTELTVQVGTEKTAIPLPTEVEAVTESGGTAIIPVTWEDGGLFDKDTPGTYVFTADIGAHIYPDARPIAVVTVAETIPEASISGGLWLDANADGIMDADETGVADYPVSLYAESDLSAALLNTQTDADGTYRFENLAQGSYVVGVASETIEGTTYMPPTIGLSGDNKFTLNEDGTACYSDAIAVAANTAAENINAGVRRLELPIMALGVALIAPQNTSHVNKPLGGNTIKSGDETELVVMEADGDPSSGYYQAYTANIGGLRDALWGIYQRNQPSVDYIMYFGANITVSGSTNLQVFNNTSSATGAADVTFASLSGKLNTLVLTGTKDDPISTNPATANPSSTYGLNASGGGKKYFGCNLIFRNTRYQLNTGSSSSSNNGVYMNGYDLTLGGGSWHYSSDVYFYGGSDSGTVAPADGTASITVYSTGNSSYASYFIGGMRTGTLEGNAEISIHNTSGNDIYIYGGGLGTSSTVVADITGNVTNTITGMASNANGLSSFIGGVAYGTVGGSITNTISGTGRAKSSASFVGGSESGDIGGNATKGGDVDTSDLNTTAGRDRLAATNDYVIKNIIDTSEFTSGRISYIGTNEKSGIITGNVVNIVKAGTDDSGSFSSMSGGSGSGAQLTSGSWLGKFMVTSTDTSLDITDIDAGLAAAKSVAEYQLYGNITNIVRAGNICNGDFGGWFRGAGWGYMEGNAYSEVGTEGVVYRSDRSSYKYDPKTRTQGYLTSFDLVGGGGTVLNSNHFCIKGDTTLILREVVARWTYGSNF